MSRFQDIWNGNGVTCGTHVFAKLKFANNTFRPIWYILEATLGLVKHLEISKELIRECVTVPGCCCYMPLLYNHLMYLCKYVHKNTLLAAKGGVHLHPLNPPLPGVEPRIPGLSHQCFTTEVWQPDHHQPWQFPIGTAQVVLNASISHQTRYDLDGWYYFDSSRWSCDRAE